MNKGKAGALIEGILKAKIASAVLPGSVLELPNPQWEIICMFTPVAENFEELVAKLKGAPWQPVGFENPENWGKEDIMNSLRRHGLGSMARVVIRDRRWTSAMEEVSI